MRGLKCPEIGSFFVKEIQNPADVDKIYSIFYPEHIVGSNNRNIEKKEKKLFQILQRLLDGLIFLSDNKILHRDLKPENIKMEKKKEENSLVFLPKIIDFGSAYVRNLLLQEKSIFCIFFITQVPQPSGTTRIFSP